MATYYTVAAFHVPSQTWCSAFGDYDRACAADEMAEYKRTARNLGLPRVAFRIVRSGDGQKAINQALAALPAPTGNN